MSFLEISILMPAIIIGVITFSLSFIGTYIGKWFGGFLERIGVIGGAILISIGMKILMEHLGMIA